MTVKTALSLAVAASMLFAAGTARAEGEPRREGFMIAAGFAGGGFFGVGDLADARASGGVLLIRFGTKATESLQFLIEFEFGAFADGFGEVADSLQNTHNVTTLGVQKYLAEVVWIRGGVGIARLEQAANTMNLAEAIDKTGLGVATGVGYDVFRRGIFVLDVELAVTAGIYGGAGMIHSGLGLGLNWY